MNNGRYLVTGAGGFIGREVVRQFAAANAEVLAMCGPADVPPLDLPSGVVRITRDLRSCTDLADLCRGADAVVHLAGPPSVSRSFMEPAEYIDTHVLGTVAVLEGCRKAGVTRFIYVSSAEVYGQPDFNPVSESAPLRPRSPYGAAKTAAEAFVQAFHRSFKMVPIILRPFSVYGSPQPRYSLIGTILDAVLEGRTITLEGRTSVRDYCHVRDVAAAMVAATSTEAERPLVLNIGTGIGTSIGDLTARVMEAVGVVVPIREDSPVQRPEGSDITELIADPGLAGESLGWFPAVTLEEGLRELVGAMRTA
jgi:UDP-glucose 4-epimerase